MSSQVVKLKRTAVEGKVPNTSNIELGELAINTYDGRIFFEKDNGTATIQQVVTTNSQTTGSLNILGNVTASILFGTINSTNGVVSGSSQLTASFDTRYINTNGDGVISGSSQVSYIGLSNIPSGIVSGSSQVVGILSSLNTYTASNDTTNTTQNSRLNQLSTASGSAITRLTSLESATGSYETQGRGIVSGSSQVSYVGLSNIPAGIVSGSSQVVGILSSLNTYTSSNDTTNTTQNSRLDQLSTASGSAITRLSLLEVETANLEAFTGSINTTIKTRLNAETVVSGSSQITYSGISSIPVGIVSGSSQVTPLLPIGVVSGSSQVSYPSLSNIPSGIVSGSSQLSGTTITNLTIINLTTVNETASVIFSSGSNRFGDFGNDIHQFTGSVQVSGSHIIVGASTATSYNGTINATNGVVSGSSQVVGILSSLNSYTSSNDTTNTTQNSRLNQLSTYTGSNDTTNTTQNNRLTSLETASGSAITRLTALEVETVNLEAFTGSINTTIKGQLNANTVVSGSSQVSYIGLSNIPAGIVSGSSQITSLLPTGVVSGSSQVINSLVNQSVDLGTGAITASFFKGNASQLTNLPPVDVSQIATVTASFDNQSSVSVNHNFNTKNVIVSVYQSNDTQIIPQSVTLTNNNTLNVVLSANHSGYIVVAKGGHIVSGSASDSNLLNGQSGSYYLNYNNFTNIPSGIISSSAQIDTLFNIDGLISGASQITNLTSYKQDVSGSSTYAVSHSLNEEYPIVQAWNTSTKKQELPSIVESTSINSLTLTFSSTFSGRIIVKK